MKILVTGANGYIGSQLLLLLLEQGHDVVAMIRNKSNVPLYQHPHLTIIIADLLDSKSLESIPNDIEVAFYLVHAMSYGKDFVDKEGISIRNFLNRMKEICPKQIIYLGGLSGDRNLSPHLASRYKTECLIKESGVPYTILRAGIIVGSGSASFEIIRDLVEKLPVMVAPKWINNLIQPIAIHDILYYLNKVLLDPRCVNQTFDIGGPDSLSYKEMLLIYAKVRGLQRHIFVIPVLTPKISSYWLYFVTSVNFALASSLVESVKNNAVCSENRIQTILPHACMKYEQSIRKALDLIEQNPLLPSWKDTLVSPSLEAKLSDLGEVPVHGCLVDIQNITSQASRDLIIDKIWSIGGKTGWYYMNWSWGLRGFIDKLFGGVGLQRGRTHTQYIKVGDALDFWRVIIADKEGGHLLLYAEMKVPGEAWLEFLVDSTAEGTRVKQTASFRPRGLWGRIYWYALLPFHKIIFRGMAKNIAKG